MTPDSSTVRAFVTLTTKLSDLSFRPFYRKMFDWAWGLQAGNISVHRKLAYFTSMTTLLTVLKVSRLALNRCLGSNLPTRA